MPAVIIQSRMYARQTTNVGFSTLPDSQVHTQLQRPKKEPQLNSFAQPRLDPARLTDGFAGPIQLEHTITGSVHRFWFENPQLGRPINEDVLGAGLKELYPSFCREAVITQPTLLFSTRPCISLMSRGHLPDNAAVIGNSHCHQLATCPDHVPGTGCDHVPARHYSTGYSGCTAHFDAYEAETSPHPLCSSLGTEVEPGGNKGALS